MRSDRRRTSPWLCLAVLGLLCGCQAEDEASLVPAYGSGALLGPAKARGAVVWSHAKAGAKTPNPDYLALLRAAGWDIFRNDRPRESAQFSDLRSPNQIAKHSDELVPRGGGAPAAESKIDALGRNLDRLKAKGYRRLVLAGQSLGAWMSLALGDRRGDLYAVIAMAPALYGTARDWPKLFPRNATELATLVDGLRAERVMLVFLSDDPYDPGGRAASAEASLRTRAIPHLVIDQPDLPTGHDGGNGAVFAHHFGACVVAFLEAPVMPARAACEQGAAAAP